MRKGMRKVEAVVWLKGGAWAVRLTCGHHSYGGWQSKTGTYRYCGSCRLSPAPAADSTSAAAGRTHARRSR